MRRDRVSFVGTLKHPLRFREAMSALHDVVISDLRFKPKDKTGYEEWKKEEAAKEAKVRTEAAKMKPRGTGEASQEANAAGTGAAGSNSAVSGTGTPAHATATCSRARIRNCGAC